MSIFRINLYKKKNWIYNRIYNYHLKNDLPIKFYNSEMLSFILDINFVVDISFLETSLRIIGFPSKRVFF
jgi:hypothetical protein